VTSVLVSETDPRGAKAVACAADAGQWIRCRDRSGRKYYGVPSSKGGCHYLVTRTSCSCKAFEFGRGKSCYHMLAVQLHVALVAEQRKERAA
jgi:hypothetical protein